MKYVWTALVILGCTGCAEIVPTCSLCTGLGGAWLPDSGTCADTCEEQAEGVLCVERVCPRNAPATRAEATTCEACILVDGAWDMEARVCTAACTGDSCFTTRCPDGPDPPRDAP